jgi:hypothetical protein
LPVVAQPLAYLLEHVNVLAVLRAVAQCEVPPDKLHRADLTGAEVVEHAVLVPVVVVAVLPTFLARHDDDHRCLGRRQDAALHLYLPRSVPRVMELVSSVNPAALEHAGTLGHVLPVHRVDLRPRTCPVRMLELYQRGGNFAERLDYCKPTCAGKCVEFATAVPVPGLIDKHRPTGRLHQEFLDVAEVIVDECVDSVQAFLRLDTSDHLVERKLVKP